MQARKIDVVAAALLLFGGYLLGASTLGGCGGSGPTWPTDGQLPDRMIQKLEECAKKGPVPLESKTYNLSFMVRVSEGESEVEVEEVMLKDSTLQMREVESCMAEALHTMRAPLQVLSLRRRPLPDGPISPESRALLGQMEALMVLEAGGVVVVGLAMYVVVVYVLENSKPKRHRHHPTTAEPTVTAEPVATVEPLVSAAPVASAAPTATAVPITTAAPVARRYPDQTCPDDELDRLENQKKGLCQRKFAASCNINEDKLKRLPCSAIKLSIQQRRACLDARKLVQDKCFGGKPDAGHKQQIEEVQKGIDRCEALKQVNCAKGHPMSAL